MHFVSRLAVLAATAAAPALFPQQEYRITTGVDVVLFDAAVRDRAGNFVPGLERHNFEVFEDGRKQQIRYFEKEDSPVTLGLVVDTSASMRSKYGDVIAAAEALIRASNPADEVFVTSFNDFVWFGLPEQTPFTNDPVLLREALEWSRPAGRTALYDAVAVSLGHLQRGNRPRRSLVVLSDGGDNSSELDFRELLDRVRSSHATIFTVGLYARSDRDRNPGVLRKLAQETGGAAFLDVSPAQLPRIAREIARDVRSRYTLGYIPSETGRPGFRRIKVVAAGPRNQKLEVRTRRGYLMPAR